MLISVKIHEKKINISESIIASSLEHDHNMLDS